MKLNPPVRAPISDLRTPISNLPSPVSTSFGTANLVRKPNGDYYLIGGDPADRAAAKEWVSLFMHEAAISFCPATDNDSRAASACIQPGTLLADIWRN